MLVLWCALAGCGYKTNPRPAAATIPGEITIVNAQAYPDRVVLRWPVPLTNADGSRFQDISGFKVYRATLKPDEKCEDCEKKTVHANVDFQSPVSATIDKGEVAYSDTRVTPGNLYSYSVSAYNLKGREGEWSPEVTVPFEEPPPAPEGLRASAQSNGILLEWAPSPRPDGNRGFRIYRGASDKIDEMKLIASPKPEETSFVDTDVEKGKTYYYVVRSLRMNRGISQESRLSPVVSVLFPEIHAQAPENVKTMTTPRGVEVFWDTVKIDKEESRYNVYRSEGRKMFVRINAEPLLGKKYTDTTVVMGKTYRYAVTAFPKGKPEFESSRSASGSISFTR